MEMRQIRHAHTAATGEQLTENYWLETYLIINNNSEVSEYNQHNKHKLLGARKANPQAFTDH